MNRPGATSGKATGEAMTNRTTAALAAITTLMACGHMPDRSCMRAGETGTVTKVTEKKVRGGSDWRVAFRDAKGITRVCQGGANLQALQVGDRIDGQGLWK